MDATQVLDLGYDEEDVDNSVKKEVGRLKTTEHKHFPETEFQIYEGINIIGRDDRSNIPIKVQALSKKHACIEVAGNSLLVYDFDSRNKSRKGMMVLKPLVRYELKDGDELTFADVTCHFKTNEDNKSDATGSITESDDTDSESMIPEDDEVDIDEKEDVLMEDQKVKENKSNLMNDSDILLPTQNYVNLHDSFSEEIKLVGKKTDTANELYAEETESESESAEDNICSKKLTPDGKDTVSIIGQTPGFSLSQRVNNQTDKIPESPLEQNFKNDAALNSTNNSEEPPKLVTHICLDSQPVINEMKDNLSLPLESSTDADHYADTIPIEQLRSENFKEDSINPEAIAETISIDWNMAEKENIVEQGTIGRILDHLADTIVMDKNQVPQDRNDEDDVVDDKNGINDDNEEEMPGTYVFSDCNYEGEDEKSDADEDAEVEVNKESPPKENAFPSFVDYSSQEIPYATTTQPYKTSTQLLESFQSFGTPTSSININSLNSLVLSTETKNASLVKDQVKMVVSDSDEEATQPYETASPCKTSPQKDVFKVPSIPNEKVITLPGGCEYYDAADAVTHMSSSDDDAPKNLKKNELKLPDKDIVHEGETHVSAIDNVDDIDGPTSMDNADDLDGPTQAYNTSLNDDGRDDVAATVPYDIDVATQAYIANDEAMHIDDVDGATQAYNTDIASDLATQAYNTDLATQAYIVDNDMEIADQNEDDTDNRNVNSQRNGMKIENKDQIEQVDIPEKGSSVYGETSENQVNPCVSPNRNTVVEHESSEIRKRPTRNARKSKAVKFDVDEHQYELENAPESKRPTSRGNSSRGKRKTKVSTTMDDEQQDTETLNQEKSEVTTCKMQNKDNRIQGKNEKRKTRVNQKKPKVTDVKESSNKEIVDQTLIDIEEVTKTPSPTVNLTKSKRGVRARVSSRRILTHDGQSELASENVDANENGRINIDNKLSSEPVIATLTKKSSRTRTKHNVKEEELKLLKAGENQNNKLNNVTEDSCEYNTVSTTRNNRAAKKRVTTASKGKTTSSINSECDVEIDFKDDKDNKKICLADVKANVVSKRSKRSKSKTGCNVEQVVRTSDDVTLRLQASSLAGEDGPSHADDIDSKEDTCPVSDSSLQTEQPVLNINTKRGKRAAEQTVQTKGKRGRRNTKASQEVEDIVDSPRRQSGFIKPKIVFTGISDKGVEKIVKDLGGDVVDHVEDATHLVTDKVRRTVKFLCAVARGIPVVNPAWLKAAKSSSVFTSYKDHILIDQSAEKQYKFQLKRSLQKACETPLLENKRVYVTKNVKPDPKSMKEMVDCSGGKFLTKAPRVLNHDVIIISCTDDVKEHERLSNQGFDVCTNEILLTGILRQEIDPKMFSINGDELNSGSPKRKRPSSSTTTTKKRRR